MKQCRKCGVKLVVGDTWYQSLVKNDDRICIECKKAYQYQWRKNNPGYQQPLVVCKECGEERPHGGYGLCGPCQARKWRQENREEYLNRKRQWRKDNPDSSRSYHQKHKERDRAYARQWRKDNPEKARERFRRYNARKKNASVGSVDIQAVYDYWGSACIYCGDTERLEIDHIVALAAGGSHTQDNLAPSCRKCNASKAGHLLVDWMQTQPYSIAWLL